MISVVGAVAAVARWRRDEAKNLRPNVLPWIGWECSRPLTWQ